MIQKKKFDALVGQRVAAAREVVGMQQTHLAVSVGWSRGSVAKIEQGRQGASAHDLHRLAEALGAHVVELLPVPMPMPSGGGLSRRSARTVLRKMRALVRDIEGRL